MRVKRSRLIFLFVLFFFFLFVMDTVAQDRVVVIPLMKKNLEYFAPVAANSPPASAYIINTNTVFDKVTGLRWQREDEDIERTWDEALAYCRDLFVNDSNGIIIRTYNDWRLPSIGELVSIFDHNTNGSTINQTAFPVIRFGYYFSATTYVNNSTEAWIVNFGGGSINTNTWPKQLHNYVRCVR